MEISKEELLQTFRAPGFPGSYFISLEGIEGSGKSTQIVRIKDYLEEKNFRVIVLREPGGTPFGEKLRQAILSSNVDLDPVAEAHLFASSRAQLLSEVTLKELNVPGTIVIYDRYLDSSLAYQGVARNMGVESVLQIHNQFPLNLTPHLTLYLKISLEKSIERQKQRNLPKDYFESRDDSFHQKLIEGYDMATEMFPNRIVALNGELDTDGVFKLIKHQVDGLILKDN
jgi:dTMP kinase